MDCSLVYHRVTNREKKKTTQTHTLTFDQFKWFNLILHVLDSGLKPEYLEETPTHTRRICNTERPSVTSACFLL